MEKIRFVVASRAGRDDFFGKTATGRSLSMYDFPFLEIELYPDNGDGLPKIYNAAIDNSRDDPAILVFAHDDLHITDYFWPEQIRAALGRFQLVGLAGNRRRVPKQPGWPFVDDKFTWDSRDNLSGVVGHGKTFPPANISFYGEPCQEVKLLDGMMLMARSATLVERGLRFDERFTFHFYDMDLCRQAETLGISMGTWRLPLIHESGGSFGSEAWKRAYRTYLEKWKD